MCRSGACRLSSGDVVLLVVQMANAVANVARRNAADDTYESPYTVEALRQVPITCSAICFGLGVAARASSAAQQS